MCIRDSFRAVILVVAERQHLAEKLAVGKPLRVQGEQDVYKRQAGGHVKWRYQKRMVSAMNLHPLTPEQKNEYTRIAYYYYEAGRTQDQIAQRLGISRQRVNRILAECIERGIVRITVDRGPEEHFASESALEEKYRLKAVRLAHSLGADQLYGNLGVVAGQ